jgi:dihydropteroate synthase
LQYTSFYKNRLINCRGRLLDLLNPVVMGILNITPDSFFDGGKFTEEEAIVKQVNQMIADGAAIIDVGAASTRPGAKEISVKEELSRLIPVIEMLTGEFPNAIFSVDTYRAEVAAKAIGKGAHLINDISGGSMDAKMFDTVASLQVPYILMHIKGTPGDMQFDPVYKNVVEEVLDYFTHKVESLRTLGVHDILIDPGFGFGKTVEHNYQLLNSLSDFSIFEMPLVAGISRKSMVCKVLGVKPSAALNGSTVLHVLALQRGAKILRAHDIKEAMEAIRLVTFAEKVKSYEL